MTVFYERFEQCLKNPNLLQILESKSLWDSDGCLIWQGAKSPRGYGKYNSIEVHKLWYVKSNGPVPIGLVLAHSCHKKLCLIHARPLTQADNIRETTTLITCCPYGHAYDEKNTRYGLKGERICRRCSNYPELKKTFTRVR